jgi:homospermidine synthase
MERWPVENEEILGNIYSRTLYRLHRRYEKLKGLHNPTIVVEHGMNPGLITHFTKQALINVAKQKLKEKPFPRLKRACKRQDFATIAYLLNLRAVHCSEKDTQISLVSRQPTEFVNTWGAYSFYGEGVDPVQLGYGTHENKIDLAISPPSRLEQNQIFLPIRGIDLKLESFVPFSGKITGMCVPHGENDTISRMLTLYRRGKPVYRPSNYYVYSPCQEAWKSLDAVRENNYVMLEKQHPLRGWEISTGYDAVGALLIFENNNKITSYWAGTVLSIEQTRKYGLKYAGPTVAQVAISLVNVLIWMEKHPHLGLCYPEDLPYQDILKFSKKWLGNVFMNWVPYEPSGTKLSDFATHQ